MKAEIISTGTELLLGKTLNTSAYYLTGQLSGLGIEVDYHTTVGDNKQRLYEIVSQAFTRSELVVLTGGLGPTADDLTKKIIADVIGVSMDYDKECMNTIQSFYDNKEELPPGSEKQAYFPHGSKILPNDYGTAPGAFIKNHSKVFLILPGPPSEMQPMFDRYALPELQKIMQSNQERLYVRILKIFGLGESELELKLPDLMKRQSPFLTLLDKHTYMELRVSVKLDNSTQAQNILDQTEGVIRERLGHRIFGVDQETHTHVVGNLLRQKGLTLATAESCTGGLLGSRITSESGSSDYYLGGIVSYANAVKEEILGVSHQSLNELGAVSEEVAREMADGVRKKIGTDLGISITGIAGPAGGTDEKPVGLVYIGMADAKGVSVTKHLFVGNRESIRNMTAEAALNILRLYLQEITVKNLKYD